MAVGWGQLPAVHPYLSFRRLQEPQQKVEQGRLARAAGSSHADAFAPADGEVHAAEQQLAVGEGEAQIVQRQLVFEGERLFLSLFGCAGFVQSVPDNLDGVGGVLQRHPAVQDAAHGRYQAEGGDGKHAAHDAQVTATGSYQQGNARHDGRFAQELGKQLVAFHAQAAAHDALHALVERRQRGAEGLGYLQLGIAAEGLDHRAALPASGFQLFLAIQAQLASHHGGVDQGQRQEGRAQQQAGHGFPHH